MHAIRVGKADTILVTPNDWSTLSNGTVDGAPTGLHRYVGEQRFVFVLLNVTDGDGDLVSYDLERKEYNGDFTDASGNGLHGHRTGGVAVPGRFGLGVSLDGTDEYVSAPDTNNELDWINDSMTVAFWVKPDKDYTSASGWAWSFGREGLWRLGYDHDGSNGMNGVRFEVTQSASPYKVHAAETATSLYAGR